MIAVFLYAVSRSIDIISGYTVYALLIFVSVFGIFIIYIMRLRWQGWGLERLIGSESNLKPHASKVMVGLITLLAGSTLMLLTKVLFKGIDIAAYIYLSGFILVLVGSILVFVGIVRISYKNLGQ